MIILSALCLSSVAFAACNDTNGGGSAKHDPVSLNLKDYRTDFTLGDEFSTGNIKAEIEYADEQKETLKAEDLEIDSSAYNKNAVGSYEIKVTAKGLTSAYEVTVRKVEGLNVLMIGNSFSEDTVRWVYDIANDLGIETVNVCNLYIGGCSVTTHYINAIKDKAEYDFQVYKDGRWEHNYNKTLSYGIKYYKWDYISLQQASGVSGVETSYSNLQNLIDYVLETTTNPSVKLLWNMTWAYSANSTHNEFVNYDKDQTKMYNAIVNCVKTQVLPKNMYKVIPGGTAVQNMRTSVVGDNLTRDGYHLSYNLGRYLVGVNFVYTLTGADITKLNYAPSGVSDRNRQIVIESVLNAAESPYEVTESTNK